MSAIDITAATVFELAALVQNRSLSSVALTQLYLDRIDQLNPSINAYITVTADRALEDARRADGEIGAGHYRGPLHGIPVALKDLRDRRSSHDRRVQDSWRLDPRHRLHRRAKAA